MSAARASFRSGVVDCLPLILGIVPFGLISGVAAIEVGLSAAHALGMSVIIFAGASQLAAIELIGQDAPALVIVVTVLVINVRMMMYSASIAPHFQRLEERWKLLLSYVLTDQAYALSILKFEQEDVKKRWYYLGVALPLWIVWQIATMVGIVLGASIPSEWNLGFTVPLIFLALLVPTMKNRPSVAAAVVGGGVAVAAAGFPFNLGLLVGALCGIVVGVVVAERGR
ncbi:AzlC family ABC transporter permease [Haladaptatus sp. DYSN1]|uniref:AzlC family ABC transporter permease n=1 Tax=unclassified Haladaptatus TaxID=2622732 RepID=UPI0024064978|nr:AzlC family ABC transporter permease [Haladaptatus sp. DYSN1]